MSLFRLTKVEKIHPKSREFIIYWKAQKRMCVEGCWEAGKWMPGNLYFFINFWHIRIKKTRNAKTEVKGRPFLRDLEWEKSYVYNAARGFSGFADDDKVTCHRIVEELTAKHGSFTKDNLPDDLEIDRLTDACFSKDGTIKKYEEAMYYMSLNHIINKGKPLFENEAKNVIDFECRGGGKSYLAASNIGHNFLFDGATDYDDYLQGIKDNDLLTSETLVGASDSAYSGDLLNKVTFGFNNLPGGINAEKKYPSPLSKKFRGTFKETNTFIEQFYDKKTAGSWETKGSGSKIHHRSFFNDHLAGNGTRPNLTYLEEVGFQGNLGDSLGALKQCTMNGATKFGTVWAQGTGGELNKEVVNSVKDVYYNPEAYDCLVFKDENSTKSRGYFVPYHKGLNDYKDEEGNTNVPRAKSFIAKVRKKLLDLPTKDLYNSEIQNNPETPEEAFLITEGNIFPVAELQRQLEFVEASDNPLIKGLIGEVIENGSAQYGVSFRLDKHKKIADFPIKKGQQPEGAVHIIEMPPQGAIPYGMYLAGNDPYDQDQAANSVSMGSTFIWKKGDFRDGGMRDILVAEFTGRPDSAETHHETVRLLIKMYNAELLYENEKNSLKFHFINKKSAYLLAGQPDVLKATLNTSVNRTYGIHMNTKIKNEVEIYLRDWLLQDRGDGLKNLHFIYFPGLLKELINYGEGNFDRVIAMLLVIIQQMAHFNRTVTEVRKEKVIDEFFKQRLF